LTKQNKRKRKKEKRKNRKAWLTLVFAALGQGSVDDVTEVWLQADVQESQQSQDLVDRSVAGRRGSSGGVSSARRSVCQLGSDEVVLDGL